MRFQHSQWYLAPPPRARDSYIERQCQREKQAALDIEWAYIQYLARRQTRSYWLGYPVQRIDRAKLVFILRRIGRPFQGQRARLERDFQVT